MLQPAYDANGLVAVIAQDAATGEVLMFAYANEEAVAKTVETGELHLWSRSRGELWHKGATSGNILKVRELRIDCDSDALLAMVEPAGPACHTGERTCFYRSIEGEKPALMPHEIWAELQRVMVDRAGRTEATYTGKLLADPTFAGMKVEEEAEEVVRAAREESDDRVDNEGADLLYHLLAVLHGRGRTLTDVAEILIERRR